MTNNTIQDAQENVAKLQDALGEAQRVLAAAERAQDAARAAHERAEQHLTELRLALITAIVVIAAAVILNARHRRR